MVYKSYLNEAVNMKKQGLWLLIDVDDFGEKVQQKFWRLPAGWYNGAQGLADWTMDSVPSGYSDITSLHGKDVTSFPQSWLAGI